METLKKSAYEQIARCAMAVKLAEQESMGSTVVGPGSPAEKVAQLHRLLDQTIDDASRLFPGGLREAMAPTAEGQGPCCSHPPGSRTCSTCTLPDDDETSMQAIAARALGTRRYALYVSDGFSFGVALQRLRDGKRVERAGWNGKGMWLVLVPAAHWGASSVALSAPFANIPTLPWIGMKTADNKFVPWLASQTDVLADDWSEVN